MKFVLVYTPGRVGTNSICSGLKRANIDFIHMHDQSLTHSIDGLVRAPGGSKIAESRIKNINSIIGKINVITAVRDPIERAISAYCFFYERWNPPTKYKELKNDFIERFNHVWYLEWFDNQIGRLFNIDILSQIYNQNDNIWHIENDLASIIIAKIPHLNLVGQACNNKFGFQIDIKHEHKINIKKGGIEPYNKLKNSKFPRTLIEKIYNSRLVNTFFSKEEIKVMKDRWSE